MARVPVLVQITPAGRIVAALLESPKNYRELKLATKLSDRWLSRKLTELASLRLLEHHGRSYRLRNPAEIVEADPAFAQFLLRRSSPEVKARLIAEEVGRDDRVVAVILFGSVAKGKATEESDVDLLIVTERQAEHELNERVYGLMFKYDTPVEAVFQTYDELLAHLQAKTAFAFGLLEGHQVLYDRGGVEGVLAIKQRDVQANWAYDEESGAWIQKKPRLILQLPRTT